ncbi:hypothetical protein [Streptomyces rimosus]|uniref:hypothetical protein n=1 Tax=Streptomyces rimosus TaxID=1927 RepID=UPI0004C00445|nr:hypothetical protein [Streptomyces rimosus]
MICDDAATGAVREGPPPRSVYVPAGAMEMLDPYLLIERPGIMAAAHRALCRRRRELFVVDRLEADGAWAHGVLDGVTITRTAAMLKRGRHAAG